MLLVIFFALNSEIKMAESN